MAGGTGLAPIKALVEELATLQPDPLGARLLGARDRDDLYDLAGLKRLAAAYPWLSVVPACSDDPGYAGERGRDQRGGDPVRAVADARLLRLARRDRPWCGPTTSDIAGPGSGRPGRRGSATTRSVAGPLSSARGPRLAVLLDRQQRHAGAGIRSA